MDKRLDSNWFRELLERTIGREKVSTAMRGFMSDPSVAIRLNPSKFNLDKDYLPYPATEIAWSKYGYRLSKRPLFTLDPLFHSGCYYVQDSSAMFVGHLFRNILSYVDLPDRPIRALDLCAAPGGKTTDIAASLRQAFGGNFLLVANEVMKSRASILADNIALWGDPNIVVTSVDPKAFSAFEGFFDIIVADVPCSGEGMFRKDIGAIDQWSEENVALCSARQKRIISDVWPALADGGVLVYSTCTFEESENDSNVKWIIDELGADSLLGNSCWYPKIDGIIESKYGWLLVPGFVDGEGQYCAAVRKHDSGIRYSRNKKSNSAKNQKKTAFDGKVYEKMFKENVILSNKGDMIIAKPENIAGDISFIDELHPLMSGVAVGTMKGKDLVPNPDLALSILLTDNYFHKVDVPKETALKYLHHDNITLKDEPKGYILLTYQDHNLGFVKNIGNRVNIIHPISRRIRMDIG